MTTMTEDELRARVDRLETSLASIAYMRDDMIEGNPLMMQVRSAVRSQLRDYMKRYPQPIDAEDDTA